ncbi:MAG TPA: ethanolamine ammonia-lyase reactivating factor EutA [Candidatus Limnocylindria bacterium]|nr:ethanolamine ammonia-lyase reactivating factor EutA [Candidatus Limnocylindria bacterium]
MHDHDHDGPPPDAVADAEIEKEIWRNDNVELVTVGVDIGSATSHLIFSYLHLQRQVQTFSTRFAVVERRALHRSPILLTPYRADGLIDTEALHRFIERAYADAGYTRDKVDAGAVILTGVALERANARAIAELFAEEGGRFVCASAGHNLEALLAAHGSGAVALSVRGKRPVLNIDIGGGTTKYALAVDGHVLGTLAIGAGARLVEFGPDGRVARVEHVAAELAQRLGIPLKVGGRLDAPARERLAAALAERIVRAAAGTPEPGSVLAGELPGEPRPALVVLSGGVSELLADPASRGYGDLGIELASALRARAAELPAPIHEGTERIRATVIGASQFTVQLSGNTVHVSHRGLLPVHNVPVLRAEAAEEPDAAAVRASIERAARRLDLDQRAGEVAVALAWDGEPRYANLRAIADGIAEAHRAAPRKDAPMVVALSGDVAASLGRILVDELGIGTGVIALDGLELAELDYIDMGEPILPANVVPVVIKSLVFPEAKH